VREGLVDFYLLEVEAGGFDFEENAVNHQRYPRGKYWYYR